MDDNSNEEKAGQTSLGAVVLPPGVVQQIVIHVLDTGQVAIAGTCLNERVTAYGLLAVAHDAVKRICDDAAAKKSASILRPDNGLVHRFGGRG